MATAFEIALGRSPRPDESVSAMQFLNENDGPDPLADLCQALLISNEFMYVE